jgi:hypothetical protein
MDAISKLLISEHLQRKKSTPIFLSYFCNQFWDNKPNQIERNVCCLNINEEGMGMINIDNFVKSKQIKFIYKKNDQTSVSIHTGFLTYA